MTRRDTCCGLRGFTLVELLVVIGIIALLISILLPTLGKARQSANSLACQSNLRQAGLASMMYAQEYKRFPIAVSLGWTRPYWTDLLLVYINAKAKTNTGNEYDERLYSKAFVCPDAQPAGFVHYSAHPRLIPNLNRNDDRGRPLRPFKPTDLRRSSEVVMFFDGSQLMYEKSGENNFGNAEHDAFNINASGIFWHYFVYGGWGAGGIGNVNADHPVITYGVNGDADSDSSPNRGHIRWRHMNNTAGVFAFADGHVETLRMNKRSSVYPQWRNVGDGGELRQRNVMLVDPSKI